MKNFLLASVCFFYASSVFSASFEELMVFPGDTVNERQLTAYANQWWQWTYSMPKNLSPVRDLNGAHCHIGQQGNVWFLAGGLRQFPDQSHL